MEKNLFNVPAGMESVINTENKAMAFIALSMFTESTKEPIDFLKEGLLINLQEASSWEEIKEEQLRFASQIQDSASDNDQVAEAEGFIRELSPLKGEEVQNYLEGECGFFLFPRLSVAFSLNFDIVEKYQFKVRNNKESKKSKEIQGLKAFHDYFADLYGEGLEVANWHQNGDTEPFDDFFESACQEMAFGNREES